jgi:cytochrome c5
MLAPMSPSATARTARRHLLALGVLCAGLLGCDTSANGSATAASGQAGEEPPAACATAPKVTWENWGQGFFMTRCGACHSPTAQDRHGAPEGVEFVTAGDLATWRDRVHATVLEEGTMPLGGGIGDDDLALLETLLACGG